MILLPSGYGARRQVPAVVMAAWLLLAILLWLNNGLRYIYTRSEFNVAKPADRGRAARAEGQDMSCPTRKLK
jgi:hypothetical protein